MKLNVGDYVRTKNKQFQPSQIAKIKNIEKDMIYKGQKCLNLDHNLLNSYEFLIYEEDIIKSSPNIIDLIEVGDYVNGTKVTMIAGTRYDDKDLHCYCDYCEDKETRKWLMIPAKDIKSIVTREQFEAMQYKVGE